MQDKKFIQVILLLIGTTVFSCEPKADHSVRVKNNSQANLVDVRIGPAAYGNISKGTTTGYKSVPEGKLTITGNVEVNANGGVAPISNEFGVHGNGKHKYTYTLDNQLTPQLTED